MDSTRTIYFIPPGPGALHGKMFEPRDVPLGEAFQRLARDAGFVAKTIDAWTPEGHREDDVLFVFANHPDDTLLRRIVFAAYSYLRGAPPRFAVSRKQFQGLLRAFRTKILYQMESPIYTPYPYRHLDDLLKVYATIALYLKLPTHHPNVRYLAYPQLLREEYREFHVAKKDKFLTLINSNVTPKTLSGAGLTLERLKAIRFFSARDDFDLYGRGWDRAPYFPYWHYSRYVRRCYRGPIEGDKLPTLARYRFALCFENSSYAGHVSEKIFDCFLAGAIPIYLGAPDITDYVPSECFIDMRNFTDYSELERHLEGVSEADCVRMRTRIAQFLESERDGIFSNERFARELLDLIPA